MTDIAFDVSAGISARQSFESWARFVAGLEAEGVRRVWVIDSQLAMKDVYAGLVVAALNTTRLGLGTGVTNAVTRHPTVTAKAIGAVQEISNGRAVLGLGAGDSALYGIGLKPQKVAQVEEAVAYFRSAEPSIPIYVAVSQERMCRLAGRVADGAIVMGPARADMVRRQVEWIRAGGRPDVEIALIAPTSTDREDVRSWASTQARLLTHYKELPATLERFRDEIQRSAETYDYSYHLSPAPATARSSPTTWCARWRSSVRRRSAPPACGSCASAASTRSSSRWEAQAASSAGGSFGPEYSLRSWCSRR